MGKHASQDMMVPSGKLSHLILVQPQFCFGFFKALLYGPPQPAQPNKFFQPGADRCIRDEVGILRIFPQGPSREEPNGLQGEPLVSKNNAPLREFVLNGPLCPLGDRSPVPKKVIDAGD